MKPHAGLVVAGKRMGTAVAALHNEKAQAHPRSGGLLDPGFEDRIDVDPDAAEEEGPRLFFNK